MHNLCETEYDNIIIRKCLEYVEIIEFEYQIQVTVIIFEKLYFCKQVVIYIYKSKKCSYHLSFLNMDSMLVDNIKRFISEFF